MPEKPTLVSVMSPDIAKMAPPAPSPPPALFPESPPRANPLESVRLEILTALPAPAAMKKIPCPPATAPVPVMLIPGPAPVMSTAWVIAVNWLAAPGSSTMLCVTLMV